jgi:DNA anti-recombination protein RmuC
MFYLALFVVAIGYAVAAYYGFAALGSVLVVGVVFVFCWVALLFPRFSWSRGVVANATTLITSTGIFFTFLGIFIGLQGFNIENIDAGISQLLEGMKTAFLSSVAGLSLSLLFRVIRILQLSETGEAGSEVSAADIHNAILKNNDVFREGFSELSEALGSDKDTSVVGQLTRLRATTQDKLEQLTEEFRSFAETVAENNSKALIEALSDVMRDFNTKLNEQFGENFKQLNEAVGKLVEWQENYRIQMVELKEAFDSARENLEKTSVSMTEVETSTNKIPVHLEHFNEVYQTLDKQVMDLDERLSAFASMKDDAVNAFPAVQEGLDNLTETIDSQVGALTSQFGESLEATTETVSEKFDDLILRITENLETVASSLSSGVESSIERVVSFSNIHIESLEASKESVKEISRLSDEAVSNSSTLSEVGIKLVAETSEGLENAVSQHNERVLKLIDAQDEEYKKLVTRTAERMEEGIQNGVTNLVNSVSQLDTEMEKEVTRVVQLMASNITSITDEFVVQYKRLLDSKSDITS